MSRENVELVRRAVEAVFRRPKPDFDTINALFHAEHEMVSLLSQVEGHSFRGAAGFREWRALMDESFERWDSKFERGEALDDDRVLLIQVTTGRSRIGGVPVEQRMGFIMTVRDGMIVRSEGYGSADEARAAAGRERDVG